MAFSILLRSAHLSFFQKFFFFSLSSSCFPLYKEEHRGGCISSISCSYIAALADAADTVDRARPADLDGAPADVFIGDPAQVVAATDNRDAVAAADDHVVALVYHTLASPTYALVVMFLRADFFASFSCGASR